MRRVDSDVDYAGGMLISSTRVSALTRPSINQSMRASALTHDNVTDVPAFTDDEGHLLSTIQQTEA